MLNLSIKAPNTDILVACLARAQKLIEEGVPTTIAIAKLSYADESTIEIHTEPEGIPFAPLPAPIAEKAKRSVRVRSWAKFWSAVEGKTFTLDSLMSGSGATRSACLSAISIAVNADVIRETAPGSYFVVQPQ